jgi:pyrroloquinoline quinone biosynthesis protein B
VIVRVLGSAAGGGVPQWNCACAHCTAARRGEAPRRTQSSIALSADGERWWLVNVSPDVAQQIEAFPPLQPRARRGTPIAGILLTDANVDHLGGLAVLRQTHPVGFEIFSSAVVREIATAQPAFAPFAKPPHRWHVVDERPFTMGGGTLTAAALAVPGLTPGYAGRDGRAGAVVAYRVGCVLFAPVFAAIDERLAHAIAEADVAFLDGSFWSDDEMERSALDRKRARTLGHLPVGGEDGSLATIATLGNRRIYTHLNNSNPLLDPRSAEATVLAQAGAEIAWDGLEVRL